MSDTVNYYDLQATKDDLQRQIWDLERRVERDLEDIKQRMRDSFVDVRGGLGDLSERISRLEGQISGT